MPYRYLIFAILCMLYVVSLFRLDGRRKKAADRLGRPYGRPLSQGCVDSVSL